MPLEHYGFLGCLLLLASISRLTFPSTYFVGLEGVIWIFKFFSFEHNNALKYVLLVTSCV